VSPEGQLQIRLMCRGGTIGEVDITSSRPLQLPRVFHGQTPQAMLKILPRLYSLCGTAQAAAALQACRHALQRPVTATQTMAHDLLVKMETAKEHLWRALVDWPRWLAEEPQLQALAPLGKLLPGLRRALFGDQEPFTLSAQVHCNPAEAQTQLDTLLTLLQQQVFGRPSADWLQLDDLPSFQKWLAQVDTLPAWLLDTVQQDGLADLGRCEMAGMSAIPDDWVVEQLGGVRADGFTALPHWQGQPCETSALDRQRQHPLLDALSDAHGNGLLPRLVARLIELAMMVEALRHGLAILPDMAGDSADDVASAATGQGVGVSQVEAARGRLVHRVVLDEGQVADYRILAPTEWNFHPDGVLARGLMGLKLKPEAQLRHEVALLINAIDPCVGYKLELVA
jgi:hypothetical protein